MVNIKMRQMMWVGLCGVGMVMMAGLEGAWGLTASLSLEVSGSNVVEYDVYTGSPSSWNADLIVTADGNMGVISSHQEHDEHGISGTLFSVVTAIDTTNDWLENSTYTGIYRPRAAVRR